MHMRVLMKVSGDYVAQEIISAKYDTFENVLVITTATAIYEIPLATTTGKAAMSDLIKFGYYDFSEYPVKNKYNKEKVV